MRKNIAIIISGLLFLGAANAASFNCDKANTFAEKAICANPTLSQLDEKLLVVFKKARDKAGNSVDFKKIARSNLVTRDACKDDNCLQRWFENSISLYEGMLNGSSNDTTEDTVEIDTDNCPIRVQISCAPVVRGLFDQIGCDSDILEVEDMRLNAYYKKALEKSSDKQALRTYQRQWIKNRDVDCGQEIDCLIKWTVLRNEELKKITGDLGYEPSEEKLLSEAKKILSDLNATEENLHKIDKFSNDQFAEALRGLQTELDDKLQGPIQVLLDYDFEEDGVTPENVLGIKTPLVELERVISWQGKSYYSSTLNYEYIKKAFSKSLTPEWVDFLNLKTRDWHNSDELSDLVIDWANFSEKYPNFKSETDDYGTIGIDTIIAGLTTYDKESKELSFKAKNSYEKLLEKLDKNNQWYKYIDKYYQILKRNNFNVTDEFEDEYNDDFFEIFGS